MITSCPCTARSMTKTRKLFCPPPAGTAALIAASVPPEVPDDSALRVARDLGLEYTPDGVEAYFKSRPTAVAARSARVRHRLWGSGLRVVALDGAGRGSQKSTSGACGVHPTCCAPIACTAALLLG